MRICFLTIAVALLMLVGVCGALPVLAQSMSYDLNHAGPDKNQNLIRDDIDAYIETQGYDFAQRLAVEQLARYLEAVMYAELSPDNVLRLVAMENRAVKCVFDRFKGNEAITNVLDTYMAYNYNTQARMQKHLRFKYMRSKITSPMPQQDTCDQ